MADARLIVGIGRSNEGGCNGVMDNHFPIVLATRLDVDHNDLLYPVSPLGQNVCLKKAIELFLGPAGPQLFEVEKVWRVVIQILP